MERAPEEWSGETGKGTERKQGDNAFFSSPSSVVCMWEAEASSMGKPDGIRISPDPSQLPVQWQPSVSQCFRATGTSSGEKSTLGSLSDSGVISREPDVKM